MNVLEIETEVKNLSSPELELFLQRLIEFIPDRTDVTTSLFDLFHAMWDKQIERDLDAGKFDDLLDELEKEYDLGMTKPL
jgi:hypothetical protein